MEPAAPDHRALSAAVRAAQADAERHFGDGPVPPWQPPSPLGPAARRHLAVVAGAALLALAALVAVAVAGTPAAPPPAPALAQAPEAATIEAVPTGYDDIEDAAPGDPPLPAVAAAASFELRRHGAQWQLDAKGVSRLEAARRLADASGSSLHGPLSCSNGCARCTCVGRVARCRRPGPWCSART